MEILQLNLKTAHFKSGLVKNNKTGYFEMSSFAVVWERQINKGGS
jgi:hypothetical protein